jgi:hypothetical protein
MPPTDPLKTKLDPVFTGQKPAGESAPVSAFNVLNNQKFTPNPAPATPTATPGGTPGAGPKSIVRTYKTDLASAIESSHLSSINIAIAENEKLRNKLKVDEPVVTEGSYSKSKILIFVSLLLVIAGLGAISALYFFRTPAAEPTTIKTTLPSLITAEYQDELNSSLIAVGKFPLALSAKINETQIPVNNLYNTYVTMGTSTGRRLLSTTEFVSLLGWQVPDMLKRTLRSEYMAGLFSFGKNLPFVILKTTYFENAYAGMFEWEKNLERDFRQIFRLPGYDQGGVLADLTPTSQKKFEDAVIVNKDVRRIKDDAGQTMLLYGIIDRETIIITVNEDAFKELVTRINKEKSLMR